MANSSQSQRPIHVAILAYPKLCLFEFATALEVFAQYRPEYAVEHYRVTVCALNSVSEVSLSKDLAVSYQQGIDEFADADVIIIPGWQGVDVKPCDELIQALGCAYQRGATLASICSGAFVLGYAGLLDHRRATTHWRYIEQASNRFPTARFDADILYCDDERIITSAGSAAGIDMCLYLVAKHYGQHLANGFAKRLVVAPFREGGQAQFIQYSPVSNHREDRFSALMSEITANLHRQYSVVEMADKVNLSERQFLRQFKARYSTTPSRYLIRLRLNRACDLLESTRLPIKTIANQCGIGSEESLRHHFRSQLQTSPLAYRERFMAS